MEVSLAKQTRQTLRCVNRSAAHSENQVEMSFRGLRDAAPRALKRTRLNIEAVEARTRASREAARVAVATSGSGNRFAPLVAFEFIGQSFF